MMERVGGVLVHPTSLPGAPGTGDLGPCIADFLDWCAEAGLRIWQVLPLTPPGAGWSPYSSPSACAGNVCLVSPERLRQEGLLPGDTADPPFPESDRADFDGVARWKGRLLHEAHETFRRSAPAEAREHFEAFVEGPDQTAWLADWCRFVALKQRFAGRAWVEWDEDLRRRDPEALRRADRDEAEGIALERFRQYVFARQWSVVRQAAHDRGIRILGDMPFFVAHDSADVWAHPELFRLDDSGRPTHVAGVPPDYFSETGQLWGNPLYDWKRLEELGFRWWIDRLLANLRLTDLVRLDHFRALSAYWELDAAAETAIDGHWVTGPGDAFFEAVRRELGSLPLVAEDLGDIDDAVLALRDRHGLPGMHVLQFGLADETSEHHPRNHVKNAVVYSGTHDNDTAASWWADLDTEARERARAVLGSATDGDVPWKVVECAFASPADTAIVPVQDLLGLGAEARMNRPGSEDGNWTWRLGSGALTLKLAAAVRDALARAGR